ncbi:hypothetical protein HanRHA438_Chr16g0754141 [Helianthus annuus]|nr:hypothetical protein HanRHA438_Chr16g0754141 [Helianthus annuus]
MTRLGTPLTTSPVALTTVVSVASIALWVISSISTLPLTTRRLLTRTLVVISLSLLRLGLNCSRTLAGIPIPFSLVVIGNSRSSSGSSTDTFRQLVLLHYLVCETMIKTSNILDSSKISRGHMALNLWY